MTTVLQLNVRMAPSTLTGLISETNSLNFILNAIEVKRGTIRFMLDICTEHQLISCHS